MKYTLIRSKQFDKHYAKLPEKERSLVETKLRIFSETPLHPSLRSKHIQGTNGIFESSINMDIRLIWCYDGDKIVLMLDIGHHDILKKILKISPKTLDKRKT